MLTFGISNRFTPSALATSACGGAVLGVAVACKTWADGGVLGVAGITRTCLASPTAPKLAHVLGLGLAGAVMSRAYGGFEPLPPPGLAGQDVSLFAARLALGGLAVGLGTSMANGCTSGHGLTGLARLATRSWVAVPTFMAVAMATATLLGTSRAIPPHAPSEQMAPALGRAAACAAGLAALCLSVTAAAAAARPKLGQEAGEKLKVVEEFVTGSTFGAGLVVSTMARASKVAAFVDLGSGAWDPSLAFVMGGGLLITLPFFQLIERHPDARAALGGDLGLPLKSRAVDRNLILGSALFGVGWGTCGMCPGPIWVVVGSMPSLQVFLVLGGMLAGMAAWTASQRQGDASAKKQ